MTQFPIVPVKQNTLGQAANHAARTGVLAEYQSMQTANTLRRQKADLALFSQFLLAASGIDQADLSSDLTAWSSISWGLVKAFKLWQLTQSYATGSINVRLSTIKVYSELAFSAGYLAEQEYTLIKTVKGYKASQARNIDTKREQTRRIDAKKAAPVLISPVHAAMLKTQPATRRGRRDALLMSLLLDHGLRCGEIAALDLADLELEAGRIVFYRQKVDITQEHALTPETWQAATAYLADCKPEQTALFIGVCSKQRIDERSIAERVSTLGEAIGLMGLSPHDCRHFWATDAVRNGTDIKSLQDAGGWSSPAMPLRYAASNKIANQGVKLSSTKQK
jgi:integrase